MWIPIYNENYDAVLSFVEGLFQIIENILGELLNIALIGIRA